MDGIIKNLSLEAFFWRHRKENFIPIPPKEAIYSLFFALFVAPLLSLLIVFTITQSPLSEIPFFVTVNGILALFGLSLIINIVVLFPASLIAIWALKNRWTGFIPAVLVGILIPAIPIFFYELYDLQYNHMLSYSPMFGRAMIFGGFGFIFAALTWFVFFIRNTHIYKKPH